MSEEQTIEETDLDTLDNILASVHVIERRIDQLDHAIKRLQRTTAIELTKASNIVGRNLMEFDEWLRRIDTILDDHIMGGKAHPRPPGYRLPGAPQRKPP